MVYGVALGAHFSASGTVETVCAGATGVPTRSSTGGNCLGWPVRESTAATGTRAPVLSVTEVGVPVRFTVMVEPSSY